MACFLVPATEAIVTTIVAKAVKSHEAKTEEQTKVKTLSEDPFLTAANDPSEMAVAFHEMATVGTSMAVLVTAVWAVLTVVSDKILKRKPKETAKLGGDAV